MLTVRDGVHKFNTASTVAFTIFLVPTPSHSSLPLFFTGCTTWFMHDYIKERWIRNTLERHAFASLPLQMNTCTELASPTRENSVRSQGDHTGRVTLLRDDRDWKGGQAPWGVGWHHKRIASWFPMGSLGGPTRWVLHHCPRVVATVSIFTI